MTRDNPSPRRLRILHSESSMGWGGQEIRILTESRGLMERGHDVQLVCPPDADIFEAARQCGVPVEPLPIQRRNLRALGAVRRWLREHRVDVINTHSSTDSWLFSLAVRTLAARPPIVRTRHIGAPVSCDLATWWLYTRGAQRVVACGSRLRQALIDDNRFAADHVVSIPTGIDTARFAPGDRDEARRRLGLPVDKIIPAVVATIRSGKGHKYLLDAVHQLDREDLLVLMVGDGPYRSQVEEHAAALGLTDRVVLPGNREDVVPWLQAIDLFVLPSYAIEGVPQAIMQAMSCGLPVVATTVGSISDAVVDGETGLLVPPQDAGALAGAMKTLADDRNLRRRFGEAARRRAVERFDVQRMLDDMEDVFYRVTGRNRRLTGRAA